MLAKIINDETKEVSVALGTNTAYYISKGYTEQDVEKGYDDNWYLLGYAPEKPQDIKEKEVRDVREQYLELYVDYYQGKPLLWAELTEQNRQDIADYRIYLKDYPESSPDWYESNPLTYDEWLASKDAIRADLPYIVEE